jgi:hypothetical protein
MDAENKGSMKNNTLKTILTATLALGVMTTLAMAAGTGSLNWTEATGSGDKISEWIRKIMVAIMAIFVMSAIIMGSLAFKQLAADGNWKDFWSKIAGAMGMFVTPIAVYWLVSPT